MKRKIKRFLCFLNFNHSQDVSSFEDIPGTSDFYMVNSCHCGKGVTKIGPTNDNALLGHGSGWKG